jgi:uncharacterized protein YydD (DUF2326 family)
LVCSVAQFIVLDQRNRNEAGTLVEAKRTMIHHITSTLPTFKSLTFRPGLNLILADKSLGATDRQTRNSAGKSSLIEIIHFLMGGNCDSDSIFRGKTLVDHGFSLGFDLKLQRLNISRTAKTPSRIIVDASNPSWPIQPKLNKKNGETRLSNSNWKTVLGSQVFDLHVDEESYGPTFRSMFSYFVRRDSAVGFHTAHEYAKKQNKWNVQVNLSYLLGLDWEVSRSLQRVRLKETALKTLKKESESGVLGQLVGNTGELRTRLTVAKAKVKKLTDELSEFQVLPEYNNLEKEASSIAIEISSLANQNTLDRERIKSIEGQLSGDPIPKLPDIQEMYREVEIVLPELVIKRLSDVEQFNDTVIRNRKSHLRGEIKAAELRINTRSEKQQNLDGRRREILDLLDSHGAIDQMTRLQSELARGQADVEELKKRLEIARQVESKKTGLTIERAQVRQCLANDIDDHAEAIAEATLAFEEFSQRISDHEGSFTIEETDNGPEFPIQVEGGRSKGIKNMQIFCFDMMLAVLWSARKSGPGFLIHDSHLFDGMDSRQIAKAIEIGAEQSVEHGFQYIVTLNSDILASAEFSEGFDPQPFVNPVQLSDANETGGLFGVRI